MSRTAVQESIDHGLYPLLGDFLTEYFHQRILIALILSHAHQAVGGQEGKRCGLGKLYCIRVVLGTAISFVRPLVFAGTDQAFFRSGQRIDEVWVISSEGFLVFQKIVLVKPLLTSEFRELCQKLWRQSNTILIHKRTGVMLFFGAGDTLVLPRHFLGHPLIFVGANVAATVGRELKKIQCR